MTWKRPENVPYPQTYAIVRGKKPLPNGKMPVFRIQDLTEDLWEDAINHMKANFCFDEPFCKFLDLGNDPTALEDMGKMWEFVVAQRCALVCLLHNADEVNDKSLPKIVGVNMTMPQPREHEDIKYRNKKLELFVQMMDQMTVDADVYNKYNVDVAMYALGLSVDRVYRGNNIGEELLKARYPLGKAVGLPISTTVFTATFSQQAAQRAGFELVLERKTDEFKVNREAIFAGVKTNGAHLMVARLI